MKLSLSVNLSDILTEKKSILENLFSWGSFFDNGLHPGRFFSLVKETNLEGIEIVASKHIREKDLEKLKKILEEQHIPVLSFHQPILSLYKISLEAIQKLFEAAYFLSARVVILHLFSLGKGIYDHGFTKKLKLLEEKYGIKIAIENGSKNILMGIKTYCYNEEEFSKIVSETDFGITFDTTHLAEAGGDIIDFYKRNKERILNIHLSDYKSGMFKHNLFNMHLPLGKGTLPIREFLEFLATDDYGGFLTLEINRGTEEIKESIDFTRRILNV